MAIIITLAINDYLFENPMEVIAEKSGFIISLCELIVGSRYGLNGEELSRKENIQRICTE